MNVVKKLLVAFGIVIGLFIVAAVAVPLFVNVDNYRPQIIKAADERLNGKLELGKLSLSLWGQIRIQIDGLQLTDAHGRKIVAVKDAWFHLPFSSVLGGSPSLILSMTNPDLHVVKDKTGKLNVMTFMKNEPQAQANANAQNQAAAPQAQGETKLPGIVAHSRLGVEIKNAALTYVDETLNSQTKVSDLNVDAQNLSLSHEMNIKVSANLDSETQSEKSATVVKGPVVFTMSADPKVADGKFQSVSAKGRLSMDDLDIRVGNVFHKAKGMDAHADFDVKASPDSAEITSAVIKFFNAEISGKGSMTQKPAPSLVFSMKSNSIDLKPWNQLVPMLSEYDLAGNAEFEASANGPTDKLGYKALLKVNQLTAKAPNLKEQPQFDAVVSVITDEVNQLSLTMKAPGTDLRINGKIAHFQAPHMDMTVASNGMDLDRLIKFPEAPAKTEKSQEKGTSTSAPSSAPKSDLDASLEPLRTNKAVQNLVANIGVNIREIKMKGAVMSDIAAKMTMRDLVASLDSASLKMFGGGMKASFSSNLHPKTPTYKFNASVSNLDIAQAVASQFAAFKNTLTGKANFDMNGAGASFNTDPAMANLNAKGRFKVEQAQFSTLDVGKMVSEGLNGSISKIADKVPGLKGKSVGNLGNRASKYDFVSSDFTISQGRFNAPNFVAKASANQGIDLKGNVAVGLKEQSLKANFDVIDTYNLTHAKEIDVNQGGIEIPHVLAEGNGPVHFPISVDCTLSQPCYSYTQVPEFLVKVALGNATGGLKKKATNVLKGLIPGGGGGGSNPLGDIGKKLFGH